jgi:hypothetical protein
VAVVEKDILMIALIAAVGGGVGAEIQPPPVGGHQQERGVARLVPAAAVLQAQRLGADQRGLVRRGVRRGAGWGMGDAQF